MSSFQNSINQLAGSFSYYTSINPGRRELQAERSALRTSVKRAEKAKAAADKLGEGLVDRFLDDAGSGKIKEGGSNREDYGKEMAQFRSDSAIMSNAYRGVESAYGRVYAQNPNEHTLKEYMGAQKARTEFEADISSFLKTSKEFEEFWDNLEEAGFTGLTQMKADELYRGSSKVGGNK